MKTLLTLFVLFFSSSFVNAKTGIWINSEDSITSLLEEGFQIKEIILVSETVYHYHLLSPKGKMTFNPVICVVISIPTKPILIDNCYVEVPQE